MMERLRKAMNLPSPFREREMKKIAEEMQFVRQEQERWLAERQQREEQEQKEAEQKSGDA